MKLPEYREKFYTVSGKASDVNRQLAFAAIALIWVFKTQMDGQLTIPTILSVAGIFVVTSLTCDLLHYGLSSLIWYCYFRHLEKKRVTETKEVHHSVWLERPISCLFWLKIACVIVAYLLIFKFLIARLFFSGL